LALRVCDFAKELKISSSALMKHLSDLGVEVRHHMNYLDDDVMDKIRNKFKTEAENLKRIDNERKRIQDQLREARNESVQAQKTKTESAQPAEDPFAAKVHPEKTAQADDKPKAETVKKATEVPAESAPVQEKPRKPKHRTENVSSQDNRPAHREPRSTEERSHEPRTQHTREGRSTEQREPRNQEQRSSHPRDNRSGEQRQYQSREPRQYDNRENRSGEQRSYQPREPRQYDNRDNRSGEQRSYQPREPRQYDNRDNRSGEQRSYQPREPRQYDNRDNRSGEQRSYQPREPRQYDNRDNRSGEQRSYQPREPRQYDNRDNRSGEQRSYQPRDNRNQDSRYAGDNRQRNDRPRTDQSRRPGISPTGVKPNFDKIAQPKVTEEVKQEVRVFGKTKKVTIDDLGDKSKHLQAKLKNTKKRKGAAPVVEIDENLIEKNIKLALAGNKKKKKYKKEEKKSLFEDGDAVISISEFTSVSELAKIMDKSASEIITKFFQMGKMVTINQRLDRESLELICDEFNFDVEFEDEYGADLIEENITDDNVIEEPRPPVITIMGHVDHGKTSILDYIRKTKVVAGESGGITQHIGAYQVNYKEHKITFLDTPGHEAFTAMRARGANITDVAIIVVAANDGVKPQTIEAIDHARAAGVTMIVAINKIDLPEANIERTISSLLEQNVYLEGWGGDILWTKTSAHSGEGIDDLLELILLSCEMKELKAKYSVPGKGVVIESRKDARMGSMSTILLQEGSIKKGDNIVCGATYGHVRRMENERGQEIQKIGPSDICVLYGLSDVPKAGDILNQVASEKIACQISSERLLIRQEREKFHTTTNLNNLFTKIKENEMSELRLIIKADTDGSVEAICDALQKLTNEEVMVNIIRKSVGGIIEADVNLASASDAIILGFHVRSNAKAKKLAEELNVEIKIYSIIFDAIDDIKSAMSGMLAPEIREKFVGHALVKQTFKIKKVGTVAGCFVEKGSVIKTGLARIFRDDVKIYEGRIASLKHFDQEVNEIKAGSDCGITLKDYNDIKENDIIEIYLNEEFKREV